MDVGAGTAPSTLSATYNGDGTLTSQTYPNGIVATTRYNNVGRPTTLTYAKSTTTWLTFTQIDNINGQGRVLESPSGSRQHLYDAAGRLTTVRDVRNDTGSLLCTSRRYVYDADYNRTQEISYPDAGTNAPNPTCSTSTTPTYSIGHSYDQADRITDTGNTYDILGRTTAVPAGQAGGTALTLGYYANDMVASETQGSTTRTYTLDPARRIRTWTQGTTTWTNHYTSSGDSPAWIGQTGGTWTRNIIGLSGGLVATQESTGTVTLQLTNLHGDVVATVDDNATVTSPATFQETKEFGQPYTPATAYTRYGWLGAAQRSRDTLSGITLMGARLYNTNTGRFLQVDPITGGGANPYDYAYQDPYNKLDLDGRYTINGYHVGLGQYSYCIVPSRIRKCTIAFQLSGIAGDATAAAKARYRWLLPGQTNAYRHSFWMAMISSRYGWAFAVEFGYYHEKDSPRKTDDGRRDAIVDLHNNNVGARFGENRWSDSYMANELARIVTRKAGYLDYSSKLW